MKLSQASGLGLLLISSMIYAIIVSFQMYSFFSYLLLLLLLCFSIVLINNRVLLSSNVLFLLFFCYSVALGPLFLISETRYLFDYFQIILGGLLFFSWGNFVSINNNQKIRPKQDNASIQLSFSRKNALRILFAISIIASIYYFISNRNLLFGGNLQSGRVEATAGNGIILYCSQLSILVVPMMYDQYYYGKTLGKKIVSKYEIITMSVIATIALLVTGFRSPLLTMYICLVVLIVQKNNIKNRRVIALGIVFVVLVEILGLARSSLSSEGVKMDSFIESLKLSFTVNNLNIGYVTNAFPLKIPFQYGYTYLINLLMLLPGPDVDFTLWLKQQLNMNFSGGGVTPTILGEFYINFGNLGIYVGMFFMGILGTVIYRYFKKHSETFLGVLLVWEFAHSASGGIANVMIITLIYAIVYYLLMMFPIIPKKETVK